jgi:conjugal transfer pilus assembly protein TraF
MNSALNRWCLACLSGLLVLVTSASAWAAPTDDAPSENYYRNHERGWFWYEDPPAEVKAEPAAQPAAVKTPTQDEAMMAKFEAYKKAIEKARVAAFLEPTPQNLTRYAELQTELVRKANEASDVWQRVIWANPQFDFTQERPVTRLGLNAYEESANKVKRATFGRLAATGVLYFFFRSDCPYCHEFAPTLAHFAQETGIKVFPVTLDGGSLPDFPRPKKDNGMAATLGVTSWPALFLGEPAKGVITPVGFGVMSDTELAERLSEIANPSSPSIGAATPTQPFSPVLQ